MQTRDSRQGKVAMRKRGVGRTRWCLTSLLCGVLITHAAPASRAQPAPAATAASDEALIREYDDLARQQKGAADHAQFIANHPRLLTATARPYGSALMWALEFEKTEAILALLQAGAPIPDGALALAARGGLDDIVKRFLERGLRDDRTSSALRAAAKYGHVGTLKLLLASGAAVGGSDSNDGFTALHEALIARRIEAMRVLIAAKAPLEARDRNGRTPLHWGAYAYRPLEKHVYEKLGSPHGTMYVDPGEATGIYLLLDAGAKIDTVDPAGDTPLHEAAMLGSVRGAEALLARGARVNVKNREGKTPLALAKTRESQALIQLLSKAPVR